jgi:hypothetical protein
VERRRATDCLEFCFRDALETKSTPEPGEPQATGIARKGWPSELDDSAEFTRGKLEFASNDEELGKDITCAGNPLNERDSLIVLSMREVDPGLLSDVIEFPGIGEYESFRLSKADNTPSVGVVRSGLGSTLLLISIGCTSCGATMFL